MSVKASVIIPTHRRSLMLRNTLSSLVHQTCPGEEFEVIVITDEFTDAMAELEEEFSRCLRLRILEKPGPGPGIRRNFGAENASGQILVFLDDDIQAEPQLVEAHIAAQESGLDRVVIGYFPLAVNERSSFIRMELRDWWEGNFLEMEASDHRFTYRDMLSGNFSIGAVVFARVKGFDTRYTCRDDYELGIRLIQAGVRIGFCREAKGEHHDQTDVDRLLARKQQEGIWDCELGRQHPELRQDLMMSNLIKLSLLPSRVFRFLAFRWPRFGNALTARMRVILDFFEKLRFRRFWWRLFLGLQFYNYWLGVAESLERLDAVRDFLNAAPLGSDENVLELNLDISSGIFETEELVDLYRPQGVYLQNKGQLVGYIPPQPGAERLRGIHLRKLLSTQLAGPLLKSLAFEHPVGIAINTWKEKLDETHQVEDELPDELKRKIADLVETRHLTARKDSSDLPGDLQGVAPEGSRPYSRVSMEILSTLSLKLFKGFEEQELLRSLLRKAQESPVATNDGTVNLDEQGEIINIILAYGDQIKTGAFNELCEIVKGGLAGWIVENQEAALISTTQYDPYRLRQSCESSDGVAHKVISVPLISGGRVLGAITLAPSQSGHFNVAHQAVLMALAILISNSYVERKLDEQHHMEVE